MIKLAITARGRERILIFRALKEAGVDFQVVNACISEVMTICRSSEIHELIASAHQPAGRQMRNSHIPVRKKGKGKFQKYGSR